MSNVRWPEVTLGDYCTRITVGHVGPMADRYVAQGIPFLRSQDIAPFEIQTKAVKFIDADFDAQLRKSRLQAGDVAIVRTGYPGTAAVVPSGLGLANCADLVILTPGPKLDPWFVASLFNSSWGRGQVGGVLVGVAQQHFNVGAAKGLKVRLPPRAVQERIGGIIRAYSELIEVNERRVATLEQMVRQIFEEWFVRFRVDDSGHTVQEVRSGVSGGWTLATLSEVLASIEAGSRPKGGIADGGEVPSIGAENVLGLGRYDFGKEKLVSREFFSALRRGIVKHGDVLLYKDGAHIGRLSMAWSGFPHVECAVNEHVFLLRSKAEFSPIILYFWLLQPSLQAKIRGLNSNAAQPGLNQPAVLSLPVPNPPAAVIERFSELTTPMMDQLFAIARQVPRLRAARNLLLPKLISGEIDLDAAERELEDAA